MKNLEKKTLFFEGPFLVVLGAKKTVNLSIFVLSVQFIYCLLSKTAYSVGDLFFLQIIIIFD